MNWFLYIAYELLNYVFNLMIFYLLDCCMGPTPTQNKMWSKSVAIQMCCVTLQNQT